MTTRLHDDRSMSGPRAGVDDALRLGAPVEPDRFRAIRTRMALAHCKWDLQVGDRSVLAAQPLLVARSAWEQLARWSEAMAAEIGAAEQELAGRPELHASLGVPRALRATLARGRRVGFTPGVARVMRFDFHPTTDGWRASEVNSDVPGGFTEASAFTRLMAGEQRGAAPAGDPLAAWTRAMLAASDDARPVVLLSAPGYMEDQQVTAVLAGALAERGVDARLVHRAAQLAWRDGRAALAADGRPVSAVVRFYQAEWICRFARSRWESLFVGGRTPVSNHGLAALSESKRLPLLRIRRRDALRTPMPTCDTLFPPAADPREAAWEDDERWVLKGAYSNNGDDVVTRDDVSAERWARVTRDAHRRPERWVLQHRFEPVPVASEEGPLFPCVGVYVIDGAAAGAYARLSAARVVDYRAMDAALLIVEDTQT